LSKILPILLAVIGLALGAGAGLFLKPDDAHMAENPCGDPMHEMAEAAPEKEDEEEAPSDFEYVKLNNQFVIPDLMDGKLVSMVVLSVSLEVDPGLQENIYAKEPKLRDAFLQVMFDHANMGGFQGMFTERENMTSLEAALLETAHKTYGTEINAVFVGDIVRQDL